MQRRGCIRKPAIGHYRYYNQHGMNRNVFEGSQNQQFQTNSAYKQNFCSFSVPEEPVSLVVFVVCQVVCPLAFKYGGVFLLLKIGLAPFVLKKFLVQPWNRHCIDLFHFNPSFQNHFYPSRGR